jgi:hypothetical protein
MLNPLVEVVKNYAIQNYEKSFGWSEVVECYSDTDIADIIGTAQTSEEAIQLVNNIVNVRDERYSEAIGPLIECPECGTKFGENTACPKCRY